MKIVFLPLVFTATLPLHVGELSVQSCQLVRGTTNTSPVLARERWQNFENFGKHKILAEHSVAF